MIKHRRNWAEKTFEQQKQDAAEGKSALDSGSYKCPPWEPKFRGDTEGQYQAIQRHLADPHIRNVTMFLLDLFEHFRRAGHIPGDFSPSDQQKQRMRQAIKNMFYDAGDVGNILGHSVQELGLEAEGGPEAGVAAVAVRQASGGTSAATGPFSQRFGGTSAAGSTEFPRMEQDITHPRVRGWMHMDSSASVQYTLAHKELTRRLRQVVGDDTLLGELVRNISHAQQGVSTQGLTQEDLPQMMERVRGKRGW